MTVGYKKVFGTGTRLYVTDSGKDKAIPPTLSGYLPPKKSDKQPMLCQATKMFPDLVKFTWKKKSKTTDWTDVSADNVVEQTNNGAVTSMMIVDQNTAEDYLYQCTVTHEGTENPLSKILQRDKKDSGKADSIPIPTCPPKTEETVEKQITVTGTSDQMPSLYLIVYAYVIMLMKNGVYFFAVFIFLLKRKLGKKE